MIKIGKRITSVEIDDHYKAVNGYLTSSKTLRRKRTKMEKLVSNFSNNKFNLEHLIKADFKTISNDIVPLWDNFTDKDKRQVQTVCKLFKRYYGYFTTDTYSVSKGSSLVAYNSNTMFNQLDIKVCPYCNENYTYHFENGKRNFDLDHFYSQKDYPVLALTRYNLVPSCKECNFYKRSSKDRLLSPYENYKVNDVIRWGIKIKSSRFLVDQNEFTINVRFKSNLEDLKNIENNISVLNLEERYQQRNDLVIDMLRKKQIYNVDFINDLFRQYEGTLFSTKSDVVSMIYNASLKESEFSNRPFSKLLYDIFNDKKLP